MLSERVINVIVLYVFGWGGVNKEINGNLPEEVEDASFFAPFFFLEVSSEQMTLTVAGGKLWWADEESAQLGTATKRDGRNPLVLRNKTSGVVHMKVYDREGQKGVPARAHQPTLAQDVASESPTHAQDASSLACCCWLCFCFPLREEPVPGQQRRMFSAVLPHLGEQPQLLLHRRLQPAQRPHVLRRYAM